MAFGDSDGGDSDGDKGLLARMITMGSQCEGGLMQHTERSEGIIKGGGERMPRGPSRGERNLVKRSCATSAPRISRKLLQVTLPEV